ncbi:MAG: prepilin-type N-terminal cleavage/methylation domain-containing protein [bacterium]|nr:prepilin-type N-terminal cleavage/methylation domain-containing protein [bacterium]
MKTRARHQTGFTLVELVVIIVLIGIVASVAARKMLTTVDNSKYEHTKKELDHLAWAITGNPNLFDNGARTDFGYVGDVGAFPPNLDALITNPGGYATWGGPYVIGGRTTDDFKRDAWNTVYSYAGTTLRSTGSGSNIDKLFATSGAALLSNTVSGIFIDAASQAPGLIYMDSCSVNLVYPDGTGGMATASTTPDRHGLFSFSNIPVGNHELSLIYIPDSDTTLINVCVLPGKDVKLDIVFPADLF